MGRSAVIFFLLAAGAMADDSAQLLFEQRRFDEALVVFERELADAASPEATARMYEWIGRCHAERWRPEQAVIAYRKALALLKGDSARHAGVLTRLGEALGATNETGEYLEVSKASLAMRERLFGKDHFETVEALNDLGIAMGTAGIPLFERAVNIVRETRGDDEWTVLILCNYAHTLKLAGRADEAIAAVEEALARAKRLGGKAILARAISTHGDILRVRRQVRAAEARAREALRLYREDYGDGDLRLVEPLNAHGRLLLQVGRTQDGIGRFKEAEAILRKELGDSHIELAGQIGEVAAGYRHLGQTDRVVAITREMIRIYRAAAHAPVRCAGAMGQLAFELAGERRYAEALTLADEALALAKQAGVRIHFKLQPPLSARIESLIHFGRGDEALASIDRLMECVRSRSDHVQDLAVVLSNRGNWLRGLGQHEQAIASRREAAELARRIYPGDHPYRAVTEGRLGLALINQGRAVEAEPWLRSSLAMFRRLRPGDHGDVALGLRRMGRCQRKLGRTKTALALCEESVAMARRLWKGRGRELAWSLFTVGQCLGQQRRWRAALARVEEARTIWERDVPSKFPAHWLEAVALYQIRSGQVDAGLQSMQSALDPDDARSVNHWGVALWEAGRHAEGIENVREAVRLSRDVVGIGRSAVLANLGFFLVRAGGAEEAIPYLEESIALVEEERWRARGLEAASRAQYFARIKAVGMYSTMVRAQLAVGRPREALRYLERGRARSVLDLLARARIDLIGEAERRARDAADETSLARIATVRAEMAAAERELGIAEFELAWARRHGKRRAEAELRQRAARDAVRNTLRKRAALVAELVDEGTPAEPAAVQRLLGKDERLLLYSFDQGGGVVFLVPPLGQRVRGYELLSPEGLPYAGLAEAVDTFRRIARGSGRARGMRPPRGEGAWHEGLLKDVFQGLVPAEVWKELRGAKRVYIAPDGPLYRFPFEALSVEGKTWLDVGPPITYVPSGSVLRWCRRRADDQQRKPAPIPLLAAGGIEYRDLEALPGTEREVRAIAGEGARLLLGKEATEQRLFELAPRAAGLHIATHLLADETETGSFSRLALAAPGDDDGFLHLYEIFDRWRDRIPRCRLVVLSACDTTFGPLQKDDAPFAMPLGFLYAGAPAVIASLWPVDDASTAELFQDFYKRLAAGSPKLEAFTEARRALKEKHPQPYHWASFVYIGDPR